MQLAMGENRRLLGAAYGNAVLSRFPLHSCCNYDLSVGGRENRGCFRTEVLYGPSCRLQVFNVHLGTGFFERRRQAQILLRQLSANKGTHAPASFWATSTSGQKASPPACLPAICVPPTSAPISTGAALIPACSRSCTWITSTMTLRSHLESLKLDRSAAALLASDHLPLVANFQIAAGLSVGKC